MPLPSPDFVDHLLDQLAEMPRLHTRRFFGGVGLFSGEVQFAMAMSTTLYFVVDAQTRPQYEALGSGCFWYATKTRRVDVHRYYEVPAEVFEDERRLLAWARSAMAAALRGQPARPARGRRSEAPIR